MMFTEQCQSESRTSLSSNPTPFMPYSTKIPLKIGCEPVRIAQRRHCSILARSPSRKDCNLFRSAAKPTAMPKYLSCVSAIRSGRPIFDNRLAPTRDACESPARVMTGTPIQTASHVVVVPLYWKGVKTNVYPVITCLRCPLVDGSQASNSIRSEEIPLPGKHIRHEIANCLVGKTFCFHNVMRIGHCFQDFRPEPNSRRRYFGKVVE